MSNTGKGESTAVSRPRRLVRWVLPNDLRYRLYFLILRTPGLSDLYIRRRSVLRPYRVSHRTAIVIDGYPRSANSYARVAFEALNPGLVVSSHLHTPLSVVKAARFRIPCVVLVRDPRDAVASLVQLLPDLSLKSAFQIYAAYYSHVLKVRSSVVVAEFNDVVNDFPEVVEKVNAKFGTRFASSSAKESDPDDLMDLVDERAQLFTLNNSLENVVARPHAARRSTDDVLRGMGKSEHAEMERALLVYRELGCQVSD